MHPTSSIQEPTPLFSPSELEKIKAEEKLRLQLRKELDKKEETSKVMAFLNSAFGMFILSTILVSGLGGYLSRQYQEKADSLIQHQAAVRRIIEFDYRLAQIDYRLELLDNTNKNATLADTSRHRALYKNSMYLTDIIGGIRSYQPTVSEYKDLNMVGLVSWFDYNVEDAPGYDSAYYYLKNFLRFRPTSGIYDTKTIRKKLMPVRIYQSAVDRLVRANHYYVEPTHWVLPGICLVIVLAFAFIAIFRDIRNPE